MFRLALVLTHACDLACGYCSAGAKDGRRLDEALGRRAIARARRTVGPAGTLELAFFGGEPLLEWPLARRLLAFAREGGPVRAQLTTNGSRVDAALAAELVEREVEVALSIDGLPEVHDAERRTAGGQPTSGRALRALEALLGAGAAPTVVSVVRPGNVARLAEGARFLADRGARRLEPSLDWRAEWSEVDVARLVEAVHGLGRLWSERSGDLSIGWLDAKVARLVGLTHSAPPSCSFGRGEVAVAPSGRLYPCERLVEEDRPGRPQGGWGARGHVLDDDGPFGALGVGSCASADPACGECATAPTCANGCACANLARTGRPDQPDGLVCALEQACLDAAALALGSRRRLPLAAVGAGA
jgi:uncharacterized protein